MASPAWLPQEMQSSNMQNSVSSSPAVGAPSAGPDAVAGTASKDATSSDLPQEPARGNFITRPGFSDSQPLFSYMKANTLAGSPQSSSPSPAIQSDSPRSAVLVQPPAVGQSNFVGSSFSYNIPDASAGSSMVQQFPANKPIAPGHSLKLTNAPSSAAPSEPSLSQSEQFISVLPGTAGQVVAPPGPPSISVHEGSLSNAANFSKEDAQSARKDNSVKFNAGPDDTQEAGALSSAQSNSQPACMIENPSTAAYSASNLGAATNWTLPAPPFPVAPLLARPTKIASSGIAPPMLSSSNLSGPSPSGDSSPAGPRLMVPTANVPSNTPQQHVFAYPSVAPAAAPSQGPWLQAPAIGGALRPPFLPYPATFPGHFPVPACGMPLPSIPLPDPQPRGVISVVAPVNIPASSMASGSQLLDGLGVHAELPPGIDNNKHINDINSKDGASISEELDAWSAHRTESGAVYYYNAVTAESTYKRPAGFKGEPDKVTAQSTPVSWEKLAGTDWALVTTDDGKKYYYNTKSKLSSWQIPSELTELRKKHDADAMRVQSMSVTYPNTLTEKGTGSISLSAPAINTGGRDATALRPTGVPGSSALDLIKKKLQDSGAPITTTPPTFSGSVVPEVNGTKGVEATIKGLQKENSKDKIKDNDDGDLSDSSSDSEDGDSGPTKEECAIQFKEMLKERGVAPFSKWEKELPKIVFDPRFKAIPSYSARKALFEQYVRTRADEERKEKRAAQRAAVEGFKQLLEEAKEDINQETDYQTFKKQWGHDPRFEALDRKERMILLNERVLPLKRAAEEKAQAERAAAISNFKSMIHEREDITFSSRWSKVKDIFRNDPRYKSVKHEDRELLFNEYISELKGAEEEKKRAAKVKQDEEEKLKERERALRKRKEREEQEVERVRLKARRKEAVESYQALLVETIKDPQATWTESKPKLEKDPQGRAANPHLDQSDLEKLFREHVKILQERCSHEYEALLAEVVTFEAARREVYDGKTVLSSWSTAKQLLKGDPRYSRMPRKERESLWRRHVEDMQRKQKSGLDQEAEKHLEITRRDSVDAIKYLSGSKRSHERR